MEKKKIAIVIVGVVAIALGVVFYNSQEKVASAVVVEKKAPINKTRFKLKVEPVSMKVELHTDFPPDYILGNPDSKVHMLEYSSMTCPHCANLHMQIFPDIKKKYIDTGKISYVYRHYPLDKTAFNAAKISHCAGKDKYYQFVDVFFKMQEKWAYSDDALKSLKSLARLGGMSDSAFDACIANKELEKQILLDMKERAIKKYKVASTPCVFINDKKIPDDKTFESISKVIDDLLK